jgi:hypothetical protein
MAYTHFMSIHYKTVFVGTSKEQIFDQLPSRYWRAMTRDMEMEGAVMESKHISLTLCRTQSAATTSTVRIFSWWERCGQ